MVESDINPLARTVLDEDLELSDTTRMVFHRLYERVCAAQPQLIEIFRMEDEFIDRLKRVYSLSKRLAKLRLPTVVSAKET